MYLDLKMSSRDRDMKEMEEKLVWRKSEDDNMSIETCAKSTPLAIFFQMSRGTFPSFRNFSITFYVWVYVMLVCFTLDGFSEAYDENVARNAKLAWINGFFLKLFKIFKNMYMIVFLDKLFRKLKIMIASLNRFNNFVISHVCISKFKCVQCIAKVNSRSLVIPLDFVCGIFGKEITSFLEKSTKMSFSFGFFIFFSYSFITT